MARDTITGVHNANPIPNDCTKTLPVVVASLRLNRETNFIITEVSLNMLSIPELTYLYYYSNIV